MTFASDAQRRWWFANHGPAAGGGSGGGDGGDGGAGGAVVVLPNRLSTPTRLRVMWMPDMPLTWRPPSAGKSACSTRRPCTRICLRQMRCAS